MNFVFHDTVGQMLHGSLSQRILTPFFVSFSSAELIIKTSHEVSEVLIIKYVSFETLNILMGELRV